VPTRVQDITTTTCPICGGRELDSYDSVRDYVEGRIARAIVECTVCGASFVDDRTIWPGLYEAIYEHADVLPGYRRYSQYAEIVESAADPLRRLADLDDVYESLTVLADEPDARTWNVLELGCGLGYTTASLRKAGLDAVGADISATAVAAANERYGPHYRVVDPEAPPAEWIGHFDIVIATEVIEHISDPLQFVHQSVRYLKPGGRLLITTPNKDSARHLSRWHTDAPPVHLFWLGRASLQTLADRAGCTVSFLELAPRPPTASGALGNDHLGEPILSADLTPLHRVPRNARVGAFLRRVPGLYAFASRLVVTGATLRRPSNVADRSGPATLVALLRTSEQAR